MDLILTSIMMSLIAESVQDITQVTFNTSITIQSKYYPKPYLPGSNCSWLGQASSGVWGINFLDVDLSSENDYIVVLQSNKQPIYVSTMSSRIYTSSPRVTISFYSQYTKNPRGRGFRIDVVLGKDKYDLHRHFLSVTRPPHLIHKQDMTTVTPVLLAIATIVLFLFVGMFTWFMYRRRHVEQVVSLNVNIRRDSGVRYTRQSSTQSQEPPSSPVRKNNAIVRTHSNRSWAVRAELTSTTRTCQGDDIQQSTVPNVYAPMDEMPKLTGKSVSQKMPVYGNESVEVTGRVAVNGDHIRVRCPTLSRVPENSLSMTVPMAVGSASHDDGYVAPSPKCSPAFSAQDDGYIPPSTLQPVIVS